MFQTYDDDAVMTLTDKGLLMKPEVLLLVPDPIKLVFFAKKDVF
jgi:hypothetical protein